MFYEAMEDVLPDMKVVINGVDKTSMLLALDGFGGSKDTVAAGTGSAGGAKEGEDNE